MRAKIFAPSLFPCRSMCVRVCVFFNFVFASSFSFFAQKAKQKSNKFRHWKETKSRIELKEESHRRKCAQVCVCHVYICVCVCVVFL